jgi:hypothetical protein
VFGFPVLQITKMEVMDASADDDLAPFEAARNRVGAGLVSCRLPHERLRESMLLEERGFRFIEMAYQPELDDLQARDLGQSSGLEIALAENADLPAVEDIAASAFRNERFHVDPRLDSALGDQRYRRWARSSLNHPSQRLYTGTSMPSPQMPRARATAAAPGWPWRAMPRRRAPRKYAPASWRAIIAC